jgi:hypothetical protein
MVYAAIAAGGAPAVSAYPTFADGHDAAIAVGEAISVSARSGTWAKVERDH